VDITIQAPDLPRIIRKYQNAPQVIDQEFGTATEESTLHAEGEIVDRTPVNRARLRGGIHSRQERAPGLSRGIVEVAGVVHAIPVEIGRKPGTMPPVDAIQRWVHDKGLGGRTRVVKSGKNAGQERLVRAGAKAERAIAWAIAIKIKRQGTKGAHMFRDGARASQPFIRMRFEAAGRRVRQRLESGS
jgi:hypothetical protein